MHLPAHLLAQKLHLVLLLGLHRLDMDENMRTALQSLGLDPMLPAEEQLLQGIAILHQWEKTGQVTQFAEKNKLTPLPKETLPVAGIEWEPFLMATITGDFVPLLPELLFLLQGQQLLIPLHWVPKAAAHALENPEIWPYLKAVSGKKGMALLAYLPATSEFLTPSPQHADPPDNLATLRHQLLQALAGAGGHVFTRNVENIAAPPEIPWEESFAMEVLELAAIRTTMASPWNEEGIAALLPVAARSCPASLFYRYSSYLWPETGYYSQYWQPVVQQFTAILDFRKAMYSIIPVG
jgi:hypothetical protein